MGARSGGGGGMGNRSANGSGLSAERKQYIYKAALATFTDAVTAYKNWSNDDPNTSMKDAYSKIDRAKKAYEWTKENDLGQDFKNYAQSFSSKGFSSSMIQAQEVFDMVIHNKYT